jgi:hypothetical protein
LKRGIGYSMKANPELSYTITSRGIEPTLGVMEYIQMLFPFIKSSQVTSLFGFTQDFSPLYGGRKFQVKHALNQQHLAEMKKAGINLSSIFSLFPNDSNNPVKGRLAFNTLLRQDIPLIQFSHATYSEQFSKIRTLMILRSIPDTLVSEYFHFNRHLKTGDIPIMDYLFGDKQQGVERLCRYMNGWIKQENNQPGLIITYEALHQEPQKSFEHILKFLQIEIDSDILKQAMVQSSFDEMSSQEQTHAIPGPPYDVKDIESRRIRQGKIGGASSYLNEVEINQIVHRCNQLLSNKVKQCLSTHGLWNNTK